MISLPGQIGNTESELKKLAKENPDLQEAYIAKQKRLKVSPRAVPSGHRRFYKMALLFVEHLLWSTASAQYTGYLWLTSCF